MTVTDLHQSRPLYEELERAVKNHRPDVVALVGDVLDALQYSSKKQFSTKECAERLAALSVEHLIVVRGNHEDFNWSDFVAAWPHTQRPLTALYGSAYAIGPLTIVGFPCLTGEEFHWCAHLSAADNKMELHPRESRQPLPPDFDSWLPHLLAEIGPAGRSLWLMHENPIGLPLICEIGVNAVWLEAVRHYAPRIVVNGHDHEIPFRVNRWYALFGKSFCVNVGQKDNILHYAVLDFEFALPNSSLPDRITVKAFPWNQTCVVTNDAVKVI